MVVWFNASIIGALARAILIALDLGQGVPPQVLRLVGRVDDGMRQAIVAVQVLSQVTQDVGFGQQVALVVVTRRPGAAVRVADFGHQRGQVVVFVGDSAAERVGFFEQPCKFVVLEGQAIAVRQVEANHVAVFVQLDGIAFAAVVTAGDDAVVGVVLHFQFTAEHVRGPADASVEVVTEIVVLAVAGPMFEHPWFATLGFPTVVTAQAQRIAGSPSCRVTNETAGLDLM